ncbi:hypothetical protein ACS0TY_036134 [Phlomoides rotata]
MASTSSSCRSVSCGVNVSNFVSGKLVIGEDSSNYIPWKEQMMCLLESEDLLGFINGEVASPAPSLEKKSQDYVVWRRSDRRVKGWILGALSDELVRACVGFDTACDVWLELEQIFARSKWAPLPPEVKEEPEFGEVQPSCCSFGTYLHNSVNKGDLSHMKTLVRQLSDRQLIDKDIHGNSALHVAAFTGNTDAARILVERLPALLNQPTSRDGGRLPIHDAARSSHKDTLEFFISQITHDLGPNPPFSSSNGVFLLCDIIDADFYGKEIL